MAYLVDPLGRLQFVLGGSPSGNEHKFGAWPTDDSGNILAELEASQSRIFVNGFARNASNGLLIIDPSTAVNGFAMGMGITAAGALAIDNANADGGSRVQGVVISPTGRASSNGYPLLSILPGGPTQDQIATGSLIAQTGQVVSCSRALSAYCMGNDGLLHLLGTNTVRVEPQGLLVEGLSTNSLIDSQNGAAGWTNENVTQANSSGTTPDGTNTAVQATASAGNTTHRFFQGVTMASGRTASVYVKAGTVNFLGIWSDTTLGAVIDASTGTVSNVTGVTASSTALGNGWYRFQVQAAGGAFTILTVGDTAAHAAGPSATWNAAGTENILWWGAQNEALPFASSYIPTTTVAVTRPNDIINVANPLAAAPSIIRAGARLQTLGGPNSWQLSPGGSFRTLITAGGSGTSPDEWILFSAVNSNTVQAQVTDHTAGSLTVNRGATLNSADTHSIAMLYTATTGLQMSVDGDAYSGTPAGAATVSVTRTPLILGSGNASNFVAGWLTNIFVDNK